MHRNIDATGEATQRVAARRLGRGLRRFWPLALITPMAILLTLQHKPGWYRPIEPAEAVMQKARRDVTQLADEIGDSFVQHRSFDLVLTEQAVNEWLGSLPHVWPEFSEQCPPELSKPAIGFRSDSILLGVYGAARGWKMVLGLTVGASLSADAETVEIRLMGAQGGSMPLPNFLLRRMLISAGAPAGSAGADSAPRIIEFDDLWENDHSVDDWLGGLRVRNRFVWPNGDRPFKITVLTISKGTLRARLGPL